jgi:hypothetical protein
MSFSMTVKHFRHQQVGALHLPENPLDLSLGHDDRRAGPPFGPDRLQLPLYRLIEHPAVKKDDGIQRLSLGRCGNITA